MNASYARHLHAALPPEMSRLADESISASLANPRVLMSQDAMNALRRDFDGLGSRGAALFGRTVQAIRGSLEASLNTIVVIGAATMMLAFLIVVSIPEVSMDTEQRRIGPADRRPFTHAH